MHTIELIFSTPHKFNWGSFLLKTKVFGMGLPFSHTCLKIYSNTYNKAIIYETNGSGIRAISYANWAKSNKVVYSYNFEVPTHRKRHIVSNCIDKLGVKFGYWTLLALWLQDKFKIKISQGFDGHKSFVCSEFVYVVIKDEIDLIYQHLNRKLPPTIEDMNPRELYHTLKAAGEQHGIKNS